MEEVDLAMTLGLLGVSPPLPHTSEILHLFCHPEQSLDWRVQSQAKNSELPATAGTEYFISRQPALPQHCRIFPGPTEFTPYSFRLELSAKAHLSFLKDAAALNFDHRLLTPPPMDPHPTEVLGPNLKRKYYINAF